VRHAHVSHVQARSHNARAEDGALNERMASMMVGEKPEPVRVVGAGSYTALVCMDENFVERCWMSDQRPEVEEHREFFERARGHVLVHGLGLGMCAAAAARKRSVRSVLVVERSPDVLKLVGPSLRRLSKIQIVQGDAYRWAFRKRAYWDVVWHDIWPTLDPKNVEEMDELEARFARHCAWQGSWQRGWCERRLAKIRVIEWCREKRESLSTKEMFAQTREVYLAEIARIESVRPKCCVHNSQSRRAAPATRVVRA